MLCCMSAIKRFWRYWCENFEAANGGFDIFALFATVLLTAVCVLSKFTSLKGPLKEFLANPKLIDGCEIAAIVIFLLWCFLLPFRRHETQLKVHKTEKDNLVSQVQQAEALFNSVAAPVEKPAEPASPQQKSKDTLDVYLAQLENRIAAIKKMTMLEYNNCLKNDEDIESIDLLNEIYFFLDLNMGKAESTFFKSRPGVTFFSINDWGQSEFKGDKWQGMIDALNHFAGQLKKIIEDQE